MRWETYAIDLAGNVTDFYTGADWFWSLCTRVAITLYILSFSLKPSRFVIRTLSKGLAPLLLLPVSAVRSLFPAPPPPPEPSPPDPVVTAILEAIEDERGVWTKTLIGSSTVDSYLCGHIRIDMEDTWYKRHLVQVSNIRAVVANGVDGLPTMTGQQLTAIALALQGRIAREEEARTTEALRRFKEALNGPSTTSDTTPTSGLPEKESAPTLSMIAHSTSQRKDHNQCSTLCS